MLTANKGPHNHQSMTKLHQVKILIVDDDEDDFFITSDYIRHIPGRRFEVDWSYEYNDALKKITSNHYDICFVDYRLGIKTGMELLTDAIGAGCEAPIILLTGKGTQEIDVKAMESGAYDYLVKSELNSEKLERCIRYSLERATSMKALKLNERKYRSMFEKSKDVVFITSRLLEIIDINYAATELLGYEQDELVTRPLTFLFGNARDQQAFAHMLETSGEINDYELDLVAKNGEIKNCNISASVEINSLGEQYIQGIVHDNTSRKRAEKAALQAEKLAATGRLVRTLAHEVRNPLNNINLSVEQLMQQSSDPDAGVYHEIIKRNGKRIGDIISELLDSSRVAGTMKMETCALQTVVDSALAAAMDRITLKHINLVKNYASQPATTLMDEEKVKLALLNIIINAIEAMEENTGQLQIEIETNETEHLVEIKDNGMGISDENMQRLFEPYFTSKRNGMGLGLASTLNIMQSHNAHIDVQSEVGKGTTFLLGFKKA